MHVDMKQHRLKGSGSNPLDLWQAGTCRPRSPAACCGQVCWRPLAASLLPGPGPRTPRQGPCCCPAGRTWLGRRRPPAPLPGRKQPAAALPPLGHRSGVPAAPAASQSAGAAAQPPQGTAPGPCCQGATRLRGPARSPGCPESLRRLRRTPCFAPGGPHRSMLGTGGLQGAGAPLGTGGGLCWPEAAWQWGSAWQTAAAAQEQSALCTSTSQRQGLTGCARRSRSAAGTVLAAWADCVTGNMQQRAGCLELQAN